MALAGGGVAGVPGDAGVGDFVSPGFGDEPGPQRVRAVGLRVHGEPVDDEQLTDQRAHDVTGDGVDAETAEQQRQALQQWRDANQLDVVRLIREQQAGGR